MDCDFYTFCGIFIEYKKDGTHTLKRHILNDTIEEHFWEECSREDDESVNDYYERRVLQQHEQIEYEVEQYGREYLYKNNMWLCGDTMKTRYTNLLKGYGITESVLVRIWKCGDFERT